MKRTAVLAAVISLCLAAGAVADVPRTINYQGRLTDADGAPVVDGVYVVQFFLYTAESGGSSIWDETNSSVQTKNGYFNVVLGSIKPFNPATVKFDQPYWLGVKVGTDAEMTPRQQLNAAPYTLNVPDGSIITERIANNACTQRWQNKNSDRIYHYAIGQSPLLQLPVDLPRAADVFIIAKVFSNTDYDVSQATMSVILTVDGNTLDATAMSISESVKTNESVVFDITSLEAGSHIIKMELRVDEVTFIPGGDAFYTMRHKINAVAYYR